LLVPPIGETGEFHAMININPQYLSLTKLLDGRLFRIPEYQRAYSWTSRQRNDLFRDLEKTQQKGPDAGHFMAATVCLRRSKQVLGTDEYQVLDVVDGQQRLTTIIILLKAITLALDAESKSEKKLLVELSDLLVKPDSEELLLLQTNHDSSHHFATYLRSGTYEAVESAKSLADKELLTAIQECQDFIVDWCNQASRTLPALVALIKNRLFFLLHEIDDEKAVYTVFEVLNSRGLDVSWIDRLKSILMGAAFELKKVAPAMLVKDLHIAWRDIYATIGLRQGMSTEALRFAATLKATTCPNRPLGEGDSVDLLRTMSQDAKGIRETAYWMLSVTQACDAVLRNPRINAVTRISQARLLAVAIHLRADIRGQTKSDILSKWENVSFRIYGMLGNDARTRVGDYVRLAWQVVNERPSSASIGRAISAIGNDFGIDLAVGALQAQNCYEGWENELRYLMFRYEEHLARESGQNFSNEQWEKIWMVSPSESIEHIWAQSKAPTKARHRLGNLVLLPPRLNSKLQDSAPADKIDAYRKTGLLIAGEVAGLVKKGKWGIRDIEAREERILKWARKQWAG